MGHWLSPPQGLLGPVYLQALPGGLGRGTQSGPAGGVGPCGDDGVPRLSLC